MDSGELLKAEYRQQYAEATQQEKNEALILAAFHGNLEQVEVLLELKANIDFEDEDFRSPLIEAVTNNKIGVVACLIKNKANLEALDADGDTPLIIACKFNHLEIAQLLVKGKASLDSIDIHGNTPLRCAARYGYTAIVALLLKAKAMTQTNPDFFITEKKIALDYAIQNKRAESAFCLFSAMSSDEINKAIEESIHAETRTIFQYYKDSVTDRRIKLLQIFQIMLLDSNSKNPFSYLPPDAMGEILGKYCALVQQEMSWHVNVEEIISLEHSPVKVFSIAAPQHNRKRKAVNDEAQPEENETKKQKIEL